MAQKPTVRQLALEKRDLARRARRLAQTQMHDDRVRLTQFAAELESEADALERATPGVSLPPVAPPQIQQQQVQQQQSADSSAQANGPKEKD